MVSNVNNDNSGSAMQWLKGVVFVQYVMLCSKSKTIIVVIFQSPAMVILAYSPINQD